MSEMNDGGPAYPGGEWNEYGGILAGGMSLRDWFAGQAMAAIIGKSPFLHEPDSYEVYRKTAIGAYDYADAMLADRGGSNA